MNIYAFRKESFFENGFQWNSYRTNNTRNVLVNKHVKNRTF